ncbi:MAG: DUF1674 domain-containing protein [Caulobacteraceae bacterium]
MSDTAAPTPADAQIAPVLVAEAPGGAPGKALSAAAKRALEEAQTRREAALALAAAEPIHENGGPKGLDPVRFGDWERKGLAVDF